MWNCKCHQEKVKFIQHTDSKNSLIRRNQIFWIKKRKKETSDKDEQNEIVTDQLAAEAHQRARNKLIQDNLIKNSIEKRITRSMANKLLMKKQSSQSIVAINNLIIPELTKLKLKTIANKLYHSVKLTQEENTFWNSFSNTEKSYILTGDSQVSLDFTEYQNSGYQIEEELKPQQVQYNPVPQADIDPNLNVQYFDPQSTDSDSSDYPDYFPPAPRICDLIASDNSCSNSLPPSNLYRASTSSQHSEIEKESPMREEDIEEKPEVQQQEQAQQSPHKGRQLGSKNRPESWKNTAAPAWKPASKIKIEIDPDSIASGTRLRASQNEPPPIPEPVAQDDNVHIDTICSTQSETGGQQSPGGIQKNRELCYGCAFPPYSNSRKFVKSIRHSSQSNGYNQDVCDKCLPTFDNVLQGQTQNSSQNPTRGQRTSPSSSTVNQA